MPKIVIDVGVPGLDGEYEFTLTFTHRDFRTIKKLTDLRANEVMDALNAGDMDLVVAIAEIALQRANIPHSVEQLWDAEAGSIRMEFSEDEVDENPPLPESPPSESTIEPSGMDTSDATELSPETSTQSDSGTPEPDSSESPLVTSLS